MIVGGVAGALFGVRIVNRAPEWALRAVLGAVLELSLDETVLGYVFGVFVLAMAAREATRAGRAGRVQRPHRR